MPISNISKQFGNAVRSKRIASGLSQEKLAEKAGLHPNYIGKIERGVRNATLDVSNRIARALKVGLPELIEEALQKRGSKRNSQ